MCPMVYMKNAISLCREHDSAVPRLFFAQCNVPKYVSMMTIDKLHSVVCEIKRISTTKRTYSKDFLASCKTAW